MVWYVIVSLLLIVFFELVGRYILFLTKINNFRCCFGIGFILFLAYSFITTSIIAALNVSFYVMCVIYALFFVAFLILIIKNIKTISLKIDVFDLLILVVFTSIMTLYTYNTSLGSLSGFDSTFYLNFVTSNIKTNSLNYAYYVNSISKSAISEQYYFQTFYYFAGFIAYIFKPLINIFHTTYYQTIYIWVFQILFNAFYFSLVLNALKIMKNKNNNAIVIIVFFFFLFTYGRVYYYNVLGFYGNTYRIVTVGYSTLILYLLTKQTNNDSLLSLFIISLIASASVSSTALFIDIFIMFGSYFVLCNKYKNILKYYSIALFFILIDLISLVTVYNVFICTILSFIISAILFVFGSKINSILSRKKILILLLIISFLFMFISSFIANGYGFNFSAFFENISEWADMTINYFRIQPSDTLLVLKIFILFLLILSLFMIRKEPFVMFIVILFICIFNPFCCSYLFSILRVFYRAFDIIVNPFTIVLYIDYVFGYIKKHPVLDALFALSIVLVFCQNNPVYPLYYHTSFVPNFESQNDNYNYEFKMMQSEKEVIETIYDDSIYYNLESPYIITSNLLTQSFIPNGRFLFMRDVYSRCPYKTESEKQLFAIFYPERYLGDKAKTIEPEYNNIPIYIKDAKIDYLVVDKTKEYYDSNNNEYSYLYYKVLEDYYPMFENDRYMIIRCFYQ